jgi:hypothetical protein
MLEGDPLTTMLMSPTVEEIREHLRCLRRIAEKESAVGRLAAAADGASVFRRDGEFWTIVFRGRTSRLQDCLGLRHLSVLIAIPGREVCALELMAGLQRLAEMSPTAIGDVMLDAKARGEYRERLVTLGEELEEARVANDVGRQEVLQCEIDVLREELERATGLHGKSRRFTSELERARLNVTRAIRRAVERLTLADPVLGGHLTRAVHTGNFCSYDPDPAALPDWDIGTSTP